MSLIDWFTGSNKNSHSHSDEGIIVRNVKSKGPTAESVALTVGDIRSGRVTDTTGYTSDVVLFLRKGKK
tara:strand:- start:623 stop:829 length:207 start_codon:yes stop_codon:yes gene_type:complete